MSAASSSGSRGDPRQLEYRPLRAIAETASGEARVSGADAVNEVGER